MRNQNISPTLVSIQLPSGLGTESFILTMTSTAKLKDSETQTNFVMYSEYASENATYRDGLWEPVGEASGTVAVAKIWAAEKGLPLGREVPWNDSQSLYAINAYHSLHCIVSRTLVI